MTTRPLRHGNYSTPKPGTFREDVRNDHVRYAGRERYYDMTPEQRTANLGRILDLANKGIGDDAAFARGWLDALQADRSNG